MNRAIPYAPRSLDELRARVDYYTARAAIAAADLAHAEAASVPTVLADMPRDILMLIWRHLGPANISAMRRSCRRLSTIFLHRSIRVMKRNLTQVTPRCLTPDATIMITDNSLTPAGVRILATFGHNRPIHVLENNIRRSHSVIKEPLQVRELVIGKDVWWPSISYAFDDKFVKSLSLSRLSRELAGSPQPFPNLERLSVETSSYMDMSRYVVHYEQITVSFQTFEAIARQMPFENTRFIVTTIPHDGPINGLWSNCLVKFPELTPQEIDEIHLAPPNSRQHHDLVHVGDNWYKIGDLRETVDVGGTLFKIIVIK